MQRRQSRVLLQCVAIVIATSCAGDNDDLDRPLQPVFARNAEERAISDLVEAMQRDLDQLRTRPMSDEQRASVDAAEVRVKRALGNLREMQMRGVTRGAIMARIGTVSAVLVADDTTAVGVADNGLLILCGIAAVVAILSTDPAASERQLKESWDELRRSLTDLEDAIAAVTTESCASPIDVAHMDESRVDTASEAQSTTRVTSVPLADTSRRRGPNQKCSNDRLTELQGIMNRACKGVGRSTCSSSKRSKKRLGRMTCSEVLRRQTFHEKCLAARQRVQKHCFRRVDAGHAKAIRDRKNAIMACHELAALQCASSSPYNDM